MNAKKTYLNAWQKAGLGLVFVSTLTLSACSDDDDSSGDKVIVSKSVGYNAFAPAFPEGIAYDASRDAFLVSSASTGSIGQVDQSGNYTTLVPSAVFGGNGSFGLVVDEANNRLHAVSSNFENPAYGHLLTFDLSTLTLISDIDLAALSPGFTFANDVTVDAAGNAYITNSNRGIIYKVDLSGNASIYFQDDTLAPSEVSESGLNGIAYHPNGFLVLAHTEKGMVYKLSIDDAPVLSTLTLPEGIVARPDGVEVDGNTLHTVNAGSLSGYVAKFSMDDAWTSGTLQGDTFPTGSIFPTTLAKKAGDLFVNNSYFNFPTYGDTPINYLISQVSFDQDTRYRGSATEIPRFNTPITPFGYGTNYPSPLLADCTDDLAMGVPDLRGDWVEADVVINGETLGADTQNPHQERIEQCGERLIVVSDNVIHDLYKADGTMYNGVNDVNPQGQPIHSTGLFTQNGLVLTPVTPTSLELTLPDVTRELMTDDSGNDVLRFFNAGLGRVVYMKR